MDEILEVLISRMDEHGYTRVDEIDVELWANRLDLSVSIFLDQMGELIARKYHSGNLTFEFCNSLVNDLWGVLIERVHMPGEIAWPDLFHEVYEAFDAGEYHRTSDQSDDPIADFTDPLIAVIVGKLH